VLVPIVKFAVNRRHQFLGGIGRGVEVIIGRLNPGCFVQETLPASSKGDAQRGERQGANGNGFRGFQ